MEILEEKEKEEKKQVRTVLFLANPICYLAIYRLPCIEARNLYLLGLFREGERGREKEEDEAIGYSSVCSYFDAKAWDFPFPTC
jgi:hypothetical protein